MSFDATSPPRPPAQGLLRAPLSRRGFNRGLIGAGMAAMLPARLAFAQAETPKKGGHVKVALSTQSTSETFDTTRINKGSDYIRVSAVYSYLTTLDMQGQAQPEVATEWSPNDAATVWTFKFKQGITFSDGAPLTAEDIAFTILRHKDEALSSTAKSLVSNIKDVRADGTDGFVIELNAPDVDLPVVVGLFQFALLKKGTTDFTNPVGTGAFTVTEFQPGLRTILDRNPNYWKDGQPYVDRIEIFPIPDHSARANALLTGEIDLCLELRGNGIDEVMASDKAQVFTTPSTRYTAIQAMMDRQPSQNVDLTMAMAHLIDRQRLLDTVIRGYGSIANDQVVGPNSPLYYADLPQRAFDPDKAKFHFQKSGIGSTPFELSVSEAALYSVEFGQLLQREAQRIGMGLQLRREPAESYWTAVAGQKPYAMTNFQARPTFGMLLDLAFRKGAVWNFSHYENDRLESLLDTARGELDQSLRKEQYAEIQTIIHDSGAIIIPCFLNYVDGVANRIKGLTPLYIGNLGGFNFADKIWVDA